MKSSLLLGDGPRTVTINLIISAATVAASLGAFFVYFQYLSLESTIMPRDLIALLACI